jgi:hypothetical protein
MLSAGSPFAEDAILPVWLVRDWHDPYSDPPPDFRAMQDDFHRVGGTALLPTRIGLLFLHASGSSQFSERNLIWIKNKLDKYKVTIVDLRQEAHGFLNSLPISWYMGENQVNRGKTLLQIEADEESRLNSLLDNRSAAVYSLSLPEESDELRMGLDPQLLAVSDTATEKQVCADIGLYYMRLPVADYQHPSDDDVDRFVSLVRSMDADSWLHIHAGSADGRTTMFLAMFDMMHNAKSIGLEEIVKRQWLLGGVELFSFYPEAQANFIRRFYQYCQNSADGFPQPWSEWLKEKLR